MPDHKRPSLTVLGGPMAGTRFVFAEGTQSILVGSDPSCDFQLQLPGVSPMHARLIIDATGVTIHDAGSPRGVHVNDSRVTETAALHNGDIVWLGTPGEADVVMLQCILPRPPAPPPPAPPPPEPPPESETLALGPEALALAPESLEQPATEFLEVTPEPQEAAPAAELTLAEEAAVGPPAEEPGGFFEPEAAPAPPPAPPASAPSFFEDDLVEAPPPEAPAAPEEVEPTLLMETAEVVREASEPSDMVTGPDVEPTVAMPPEHAEPAEPTALVTPPAAPPPRAEPAVSLRAPAPPVAARPPAPPAATARPPRPTPPATPPGPKRETTPSPRPRPHAERHGAAPATVPSRRKSSSPVGLYAVLGLALVAVVGGGLFAARRFLPTTPPSTQAVQAPLPPSITPAATLPSAPPPTIAVAPTPRPAPVEEAVTIVKPTPPPALATPAAPTPSPSPKKAGATPAPATTAAAPSAEAQRAQQAAAQVAGLLAQADNAMGARQYDAAIGALDEVLKLDPGNAKAAADKASAMALRDAARKRFLPGRTVVKTEKAQEGLAGFEGAAVQKAPDFLGRIEFEMDPVSGIRPGDSYNLKFYLVNEGKKTIRIGSVNVNTTVNGSGSGSQVATKVREVDPQQRSLLGEISGAWKDGTTSWSTEVLVTANKGDSLKNQITWR